MADPEKKVVEVGSKVTIKMGEKERILTIVEIGKVNTEKGFISIEAPLAKALLGGKIGDIVNFINPIGNKVFVEILKIN